MSRAEGHAIADAGIDPSKIDEVVLVGRLDAYPQGPQEIVRNLFGKEPNRSVNPDEVVIAVGAAVQGGVLGGEVKNVLLLDADSAIARPNRRWVAYSPS